MSALLRALLECKEVFPHLTNLEIPVFSTSQSMAGVVAQQFKGLGPMNVIRPLQYESARQNGTLDKWPANTYYRAKDAEGSAAGASNFRWVNIHTGRAFRIFPTSIRSMVGTISRLLCLFDELGDAISPDLFDTFRTGQTGSLLGVISTQGTVGSPMHEHCVRMERLPSSPRYSIHVRSADAQVCRTVEGMGEEDQWRAANPVLGSDILTYDHFRADYDVMVGHGDDRELTKFREKRLNLPVLATEASDLFDYEQVAACHDPEREAVGPCLAGIDLAQVNDFCGVAFWWPHTHKMLLHCFIPGKEKLEYYTQKHDYPLGDLMKAGYVTQSDEEYIDFRQVSEYIVNTLRRYRVRPGTVLCGADHYKLSSFRRTLRDSGLREGVDFPILVKVRQSSQFMGNFVVSFRNLVRQGKMHINGADLLIHALRAAHVARDSQLNLYFKRENQFTQRIDPLIAALMAVNVADYLDNDAPEAERERARYAPYVTEGAG